MAGTIEFDKYNNGVPFKTSFYTLGKEGLTSGGLVTMNSTNTPITHTPMCTGDKEPTTTVKVRSYEIYIDSTEDGTTKQTNKTARITKDSSSLEGFDILVTEANTGEDDYTVFDITVQNLLTETADIRVVLVCEVTI